MWAPVGEARFFVFTAVYWAAAGLILWIVPKWLGVIGGAFVLVYTAWWTGPSALLATLYFLGSCLLLGRILWRRADLCTSLLLGAAAWMLAIWTALHFPVNTRGVYLAAFAIPYVWEARRLPHFQLRCES